MTVVRLMAATLLTAVAVASCGKPPKPPPITDTNVFPADYKNQIATYLSTVLADRADFTNALIGAPVLKQVGEGQHYVVCVQFNGHNQHREKVVIYLATNINQFVDAKPGQCADAAYQPFAELAALLPHR